MANSLLAPPLAFAVVLTAVYLLFLFSAGLAFRRSRTPAGLKKAYTGGEEVTTNRVQPDYSQFFPFAFFFTLLHVVTLTIATICVEKPEALVIALIYLLGAVLGLFILFRR
jgi:hypothetical protein